METNGAKKKYACKVYFKSDVDYGEYCEDVYLYRDSKEELVSGVEMLLTDEEKEEIYRAFLQKEGYSCDYSEVEMGCLYATGYCIDRVILICPAK